ncbi:hypothetical protein NPIL_296021 [Nephila pilipes]|uniref:Uncharacterized protein n=1 Tax=Nephila pilipes TaxID=299642 RepID=A0A8X6U0D9_NEPPI|nr:hypothetical protein NPIL_296021 [Nephila pilipes]
MSITPRTDYHRTTKENKFNEKKSSDATVQNINKCEAKDTTSARKSHQKGSCIRRKPHTVSPKRSPSSRNEPPPKRHIPLILNLAGKELHIIVSPRPT